jgi:ABC-2 type transport system ATP-binding protein
LSAIAAVNLSKRYGAVYAVDHANFTIERGEVVGFLGPNGAGKTTALRMLAGLIRPTSGERRILNQPVPGPALRHVGTMIEEPSFYPYMSGRDNLRYAARLRGEVSDRRVDEVLEFVKLDLAANKRVKAYSQGMRQRLGLARALLAEPEVLMLDEPTNGLDPVGIAEIRENLRAVANRGVTVLISSHILAEIEKVVGRILAINKGKILYDGSLQLLLRRLDASAVSMRLSGPDLPALQGALTDRGLTPTMIGSEALRVSLPTAEADGLVRSLALAGVALSEVRREVDDLEGAYLRLIQDSGRPS